MKTFIRNIFLAGGLSGIMILAGCKKHLDINRDPNNPRIENGTPALIFPAAVAGTTAAVGGELAILGAIWGEYTTQSAASNQYKTISSYGINRNDFNFAYAQLFANGLKNYQAVMDKSKASENWNFYLMAATMKAYTTQVLVDLWGSVPYFEALQEKANLNPKFDDGYEIYVDLLKTLDTALSKPINPAALTDADITADLIFDGDLDNWAAFANTLELKMYLRMVNKKPAEAQVGIKKLYDAGAKFLDVDAGVFTFEGVTNKSNPMYEQNIRQLNTPNNIRASYTFTSFLMQKGDPRIVTYFGSSTPNAINQGDFTATDPTSLGAATLVESATDPVIFISAAESDFMQAEALERYYSGAGAKAKYDEGVLTAFLATGNDGGLFINDTTKYQYPKLTAPLEEKIEAISIQKWIDCARGVHFLEGFFEKNRTGFPKTSPVYSTDPAYEPGQFVVSNNSVLDPGQLPQRLLYPDSERQSNISTPPEVPVSTPVWWAL